MSKNSDPKRKGQKYQNKRAFAVCSRLTVLTPQQESIKHTQVAGLCKRCTEIIKWKIKYGKYKSLSVPKKCLCCGMKSVTRAYFTLCKGCADEKKCCAKCQDDDDDVIGAFPETQDVKVKEMNYLKEEMKYMKERDRRKLIRGMNKTDSTKVTKQPERNADTSDDDDDDDLEIDEKNSFSDNDSIDRVDEL